MHHPDTVVVADLGGEDGNQRRRNDRPRNAKQDHDGGHEHEPGCHLSVAVDVDRDELGDQRKGDQQAQHFDIAVETRCEERKQGSSDCYLSCIEDC